MAEIEAEIKNGLVGAVGERVGRQIEREVLTHIHYRR